MQNSRAASFPDMKKTKARRHNVLLKEILTKSCNSGERLKRALVKRKHNSFAQNS